MLRTLSATLGEPLTLTCSPLAPLVKPTGFVLMSLPPCTNHQFYTFAWRLACRARSDKTRLPPATQQLSPLDRTAARCHAMLCGKAAPASGRRVRSWRRRRRPAAAQRRSPWRPLQHRSPCPPGPWPAAELVQSVWCRSTKKIRYATAARLQHFKPVLFHGSNQAQHLVSSAAEVWQAAHVDLQAICAPAEANRLRADVLAALQSGMTTPVNYTIKFNSTAF